MFMDLQNFVEPLCPLRGLEQQNQAFSHQLNNMKDYTFTILYTENTA